MSGSIASSGRALSAMRSCRALSMLTRCTRRQFSEIGSVMSPGKRDQKRSSGKKLGRLFEIFDEHTPIIANTTTNVPAPAIQDLPPVVVTAEPTIPTEMAADSPTTMQDTESTVFEYEIDALLLGEKVLPARPTVVVTSDDDTTISEVGLGDEEIARPRDAEEQATAASFGSLLEMGFPGEKVLLALVAAKGDENLAVEYLLSGIPQERPEEIDPGDRSSSPYHESVNDEDVGELDQEERERLVARRTRSQGFSEEEVEHTLEVFREDMLSDLDLELAGPASARAAASTRRILTTATLPPLLPTLAPQLSATRCSSTTRSETLSPRQSTQALHSASTSAVRTPDYILPFTNGDVPASPPIDSCLTRQPPTTKSLKRSLDTSFDTTKPRKKQKTQARAPTPPRYKDLTRGEHMKHQFGEDEEDGKPKDPARRVNNGRSKTESRGSEQW